MPAVRLTNHMTKRTPTRRGGSGRKRVSQNKTKESVGIDRCPAGGFRIRIRERLGRQTDDVWGMLLDRSLDLIVLGFLDLAGPLAGAVADGLHFLFGLWRFLVPAVMAAIGVALIAGRPRQGVGRAVVGAVTIFFASLALFHLFTGGPSLFPDVKPSRPVEGRSEP